MGRKTRMVVATMVASLVGATAGIVVLESTGTASAAATALPAVAAPAATGHGSGGYTPLVPARLLDTRPTNTPVGEGASIDLQVTGVGGVPAVGVDSVVLNVTATEPTAASFITVWPTGQPRPWASNLNVVAHQTVPNLVVAKVGDGGRVSVYNNSGSVHVVIDVQGWFAPASGFSSLVPARLLDTREPNAAGAVVHVGSQESIDLGVVGVGGVPAEGVGAVVLNVTATEPSHSSYLTVWPAGDDRPTASNLNMLPGQTVPNLVIARVGAGGRVSIYNNSGFSHVVVDVEGWFAADSGFTSLVPARLLDTREPSDGGSVVPIGSQSAIELDVTGVGGVPSDGVSAVALNVTATEPTDDSFLTVWPTSQDRPFASNLNVVQGQTVPNLVIAKVGADGKVSIYNNNGATHVVVDVQGWFAEATGTGPEAPVTEGPQVGWRFVPRQILVAPGDTRVVQLVQTGLDGLPTGSGLPAGVTFEMTGEAGSVTARTLGGGDVEITAGQAIDTAVVAAHIPNVAGATTIAVTVARLKPGVVQIDDATIAFPQPNLPDDGDFGKIIGPDTTASGVGPFTWAQIEARLDVPDVDLGDPALEGLGNGGLGAINAQYPLVLRGDAPPIGTLIIGNGGSAVVGRIVISPAGPTLTQDGFSLVTVELVGLQEVYSDLKYSLTYDDLIRIGAAPPLVGTAQQPAQTASALQAWTGDGPSRATHSAAAGRTPAPNDNTVDPPTPPDPGTPDPNAPVNAQVAAPGNVVNGGQVDTAQRCEGAASFGLFELSPAVTLDIIPVLNLQVNIVDDALIALQVEVGGTLTLTVNAKAKFQLTGSATVTCKIAKLGDLEIVAPGPFAAFLSVTGEAEQKFRVAVSANGGPKLEIGFSCSLSVSLIGGFTYETAAGVTNLSRGGLTPDCQPAGGPAVNASDDGIGFSLEPTVGVPLAAPMGMRAGGAVVGSISRFLSWFSAKAANIGKFKAVEAEVTPQVRLTTENATNAMTFKNAKSALTAELVGKISLSIEPLDWLLKRFGIGGDGSFGVDLFSETLPIASGYAALNSTRIEATVAGDDAAQEPAVYVQSDDAFSIVSTLAPASSGVGIVAFPIDTAALYEAQADSFLSKSDLFTVAVVPSTGAEAAYGNTSIKVSGTITPQLCDQLRAAPREFVMIGDAPLDLGFTKLPAPAYGGRFKIQCVDGKIAWDQTEITDLNKTGVTPASITTSGPKDDQIDITGAPAWLKVDPELIELIGDPEGTEVTESIELSERSVFEPIGCHEPREATLTATTQHRGASIVHITEEDPCYLKFDPLSITGPGQVTANLVTKGKTDDFGQLNTASLPDWITVSPDTQVSLPGTAGAEQMIPFTFTITEREKKCVVQLPRSFDFKVTSLSRGVATLHIIDPKVDPYDDCGFKFTPNHLADTGSSTLKLRDDELGDGTAQWEIDDPSSLPDWLGVTPMSGTISADSPAQVGFAVLGTSFDPCVGRPKATTIVSATATIPASGLIVVPTTRTATISVSRPAIPPVECPRTHGGARGDPHMVSMDGVGFEGQFLGDYVYARSPVGAADPYQIVVRTAPTNGSEQSVAPTSVTAVAITQGDHTVEMYPQPYGHDLLVDGVLTPLDDGEPFEVSPTITVTQTGYSIRIDLPGITVSLATFGTFYNLDLAAGIGTPMEGLLGTPDGNRDNDFTSSTGTIYPVVDMVDNKVPDFYDFVTSWRITDPDQTPLSRPSAVFATPNPGFDQAILDQYGPQVNAALGGSDQICTGGPTGKQLYGLALELSIGTPLADLDRYICSYSVSGFVTTDGLPTPGLHVSVDAVGLRPCVTTSGSDGRYVCVLLPDLAEVNAAPPPVMPLHVQVAGRWPGKPDPVAAGAVDFDTKAAFNSGPSTQSVDLAVDPNSAPRLNVSGVVTRDGEPVAGERAFQVVAYDANNTTIHQTTAVAVVDITTGVYSFSRILPNAAVRAVVTTLVDSPVAETFTTEAAALLGGPRAVDFDVIYTVPTLTVSGTITDGVNSISGPIDGFVIVTAAGGASLPTQGFAVSPDALTGEYSVTIALPRQTASATAMLNFEPYDETYSSLPVVMGQTGSAVTLNVVHNPPVADISGNVVDEAGQALPQASLLTATFRNAGGTVVGTRTASVGAGPGGSYAVSLPGPKTATSVVIRIAAGVQGEAFDTPQTPVTPGPNSIAHSVQLASVRLALSGVMVDENGGPLGVVPVQVFFRDSTGQFLGGTSQNITPGAGGAYSATFVGHRDAVSADITATAGAQFETFTATASGLHTGTNSFPFSISSTPVRVAVSGHVTDTSGAALPGNIRIDAYFLNGSGQVLSTQTAFSVTPDTSNGGAYSTSFSGHRDAVSMLLRAFVGPIGEFVEATASGLAPGDNSFTFEIVYGAPVVTISGRMTGPGGTKLTSGSVPIRIIGTDDTGDDIYNQLRFVTLDDEGDYAITTTMSQNVIAVEATAQVGVASSDWFTLASTPVVPGNNTIPFDVVYLPPTVTVTGTMTSAPGVPLGAPYAPVPVGVSALNANGDLLYYTQPSITPGAGGAYSFDRTLPLATVSIEVRAFITGENIAQIYPGFAPDVHQTATLNVVHNPPTVTVQGVAQLNGVPETRDQSVIVTIRGYNGANPTPTYQATTYKTPNASGFYSAAFTLKHGATRAEVEVEPRYGSGTYPAAVDDLLAGEQRTVTVDFDEQPTTVQLSGTFDLFGQPALSAYLWADAYDAADQPTPVSIGLVDVDDIDGTYSHEFAVPDGTVRVTTTVLLMSPDWGGSWSTSHDTTALVANTTNQDSWSTDATLLRVTGTLVEDGQRVVLPGDDPDNGEYATLSFGVNATGSPDTYGYDATYEPDNSFAFDAVVDAAAIGVTLKLFDVGIANPTVTFGIPAPSIIDHVWDIEVLDYSTTQYLTYGVVTDNGVPVEGRAATIDVVGFSYTGRDTPFFEVFRRSLPITTLGGGYYGVAFDLPANVTLARSTLTIDDPLAGDGWNQAVEIVPGVDTQLEFNIDIGLTTLSYSGNIILDGCTGPLVFEREFWAFDSVAEPTTEYDWNTNTWPGGTLVSAFIVVPETTAPYEQIVRTHLPAGTTWLGTVYSDHNSAGTGMLATSPGSAIGIGADETHHC